MQENGHYHPGDVIVFRGASPTHIWYAIPVYVVQDTPDLLVIYWPSGTRTMMRKRTAGVRVIPRDVLQEPMQLLDSTWTRTDVLMLMKPGAAYAIYVMWETGSRQQICWYCNLQDPFRRTPIGYDTRDHWLDVVFAPDRSGWQWKDEDELESAVALGMISAERAQTIRAEGERVIGLFAENQPPFCDGWERWSPPADWGIPALAAQWDLGYRER